VNEIYHHALKLLRTRDHSTQQLIEKLRAKFGSVPPEVLTELRARHFLDDRRFAENLVRKRSGSHRDRVREELAAAGLDSEIIDSALANAEWPSLRDVLKAKMADSRLRAPLQRREVARLFRALSRLGYSEEELREELEQLHDQQ
jgi:SOS response regulatory protein OraA/RecX